MVSVDQDKTPPDEFSEALATLDAVSVRPEITMSEISAPANLAPWTVARTADVRGGGPASQRLATGRIVILYDVDEPSMWGGPFRVICFAKSVLEVELGADPLMSDVAWSWLTESLETEAAAATAISGTVSRVINTGYGTLADRSDGAEVELRGSWTLHSPNVVPSVNGWLRTLSQMAGLPPVADGVEGLDARRRQRS